MAARRDHNADPSGPAGPARAVREPTESLALIGDEWSSSGNAAPLAAGSDEPRPAGTQVEGPPAQVRPWRAPPSTSASAAAPKEKPEELVGAVLGSYRLIELIGRGGMGFVYRAEHTRLGREVALKLLRADYAKRRDAVARFFQEARTVNRVRHRNIVDVTDFIDLPDGTTFIIMELLRGQNLGRWAKSGVEVPRALALISQICEGLAAAHAVGVVHRDLKPDNVIVVTGSDGAAQVKLLDFGVAKLLNHDDEDVGLETAAGSVIGTPAYMSPEQAGGLTVDARSDIYSLGAIMYELFCACPMFRGRSFGEYVRKHLTETPTRPRHTPGGAGMDERLEAMILRCLEKDPARRYQHIEELRDELLALIGGLETHPGDVARIAALDAAALDRAGIPTLSSAYYTASSVVVPTTALVTRRRWPWITAGVALLAGGAGVAFAIATSSARPALPVVTTAAAQPAEVRSIAPAAPGAARTIDVRIAATPPGDVFAAGAETPLCSTPCSITLDPGDGGPRDRRMFVVRRAGYLDEPVAIDLDGPAQEVSVALMRARRKPAPPPEVAPADPTGDTAADPTGSDPAVIDDDALDDDDTDAPARGTAKRPARTRRDRDDARKPAPAARPSPPPRTEPAAPEPPRKRPGPVDPADTLDPFR
jgi:serine/threonine protein kinase